MSLTKFKLLWISIVILAIVLRFWGLGLTPTSLYWDEAAMAVDARLLAQTGEDMHGLSGLTAIFPSYGDYKLPVYIWFSIPFTYIPVSVEVQIRLVSALAGVFSVIVIGALTYKLLASQSHRHRQIAQLSSMFVLAILPWSIMFSHTAFEGHLAQFFIALSIYCFLNVDKKPSFILLASLLGSISIYTYYSARFVWPLLSVFALAWLLWQHRQTVSQILAKPKKYQKVMIKYAIFGLLSLVLVIVAINLMIHSSWYSAGEQIRLSSESLLTSEPFIQEQNVLREVSGNDRVDRVFSHRHLLQLKAFLGNLSDHLSINYLFFSGDENLRHGTTVFGLGYVAMIPLLLIGLYQLWLKQKSTLWFLLAWWLLALVPASIPTTTPHALRSLNAMMPFAIILGFGLASFFINQSKIIRRLGFVILFFNILCLVRFSYVYHWVYPTLSVSEWQGGYKEVALAIKNLRNEYNHAISYADIGDGRFFLWYLLYTLNSSEYDSQRVISENFSINQIEDHTYFKLPDETSFYSLDRPLIIATSEDRIAELPIPSSAQVTEETSIFNPADGKFFKVLLITKKTDN